MGSYVIRKEGEKLERNLKLTSRPLKNLPFLFLPKNSKRKENKNGFGNIADCHILSLFFQFPSFLIRVDISVLHTVKVALSVGR